MNLHSDKLSLWSCFDMKAWQSFQMLVCICITTVRKRSMRSVSLHPDATLEVVRLESVTFDGKINNVTMTPWIFFYDVIVWQQVATFPSSYAQTIFLTISQGLPIILILRWTKNPTFSHLTRDRRLLHKDTYPSAPDLIQW